MHLNIKFFGLKTGRHPSLCSYRETGQEKKKAMRNNEGEKCMVGNS